MSATTALSGSASECSIAKERKGRRSRTPLLEHGWSAATERADAEAARKREPAEQLDQRQLAGRARKLTTRRGVALRGIRGRASLGAAGAHGAIAIRGVAASRRPRRRVAARRHVRLRGRRLRGRRLRGGRLR